MYLFSKSKLFEIWEKMILIYSFGRKFNNLDNVKSLEDCMCSMIFTTEHLQN